MSERLVVEFNDAAAVFGRDVFSRADTTNDAFVHNFHLPLCASDVYTCGRAPADFEADFHAHLTAVEPSVTRIEVFALRPMVVCGASSSFLSIPGHSPVAREVDVDPTSIEEYRILLAIGAELGVKDMPPLRLPEPNAKRVVVRGKGHY
jgi:hypothetical protein